jgi:spore coat protein U-like protein
MSAAILRRPIIARRIACQVLCTAALMAWAAPAQAACTGIGLFTCSATVSVALPLAFGNYNPAAASIGSTDISVTGSVGGVVGVLVNMTYAISLSAGAGGTVANRVLNGPGTPLAYNLYTSDAYQTVWGNDGRSDSYSLLVTLLGNSLTRSYTVYGLIPAGQYVATGGYSNTITVSVVY